MMKTQLKHPKLVKSLQKAHSAERAASLAYIGHAASLRDPEEKAAIQQIEQDEWEHRRAVLEIMRKYSIPVSKYEDAKWLPLFERIFNWGTDYSANDVDLEDLLPVEEGSRYCSSHGLKKPSKGKSCQPGK